MIRRFLRAVSYLIHHHYLSELKQLIPGAADQQTSPNDVMHRQNIIIQLSFTLLPQLTLSKRLLSNVNAVYLPCCIVQSPSQSSSCPVPIPKFICVCCLYCTFEIQGFTFFFITVQLFSRIF